MGLIGERAIPSAEGLLWHAGALKPVHRTGSVATRSTIALCNDHNGAMQRTIDIAYFRNMTIALNVLFDIFHFRYVSKHASSFETWEAVPAKIVLRRVVPGPSKTPKGI